MFLQLIKSVSAVQSNISLEYRNVSDVQSTGPSRPLKRSKFSEKMWKNILIFSASQLNCLFSCSINVLLTYS